MQLQTPDGRVLDVVTAGETGPAVLFHHGTPSAAEDFQPWIEATVAAGLRWVSVTRPGYGHSTRRAGRSVADNCDDVATVLDALGVDRFVAMGWSGGGPHALACGALLAPRCAAVITLAGVAPLDEATTSGLDWYDGMGPENHEEFGAALAGEQALRAVIEPQVEELRTVTAGQVAEALGGLVDEPDRLALTGEFGDSIAASFRQAVISGADGWVDDDLAFVRNWGFGLPDVAVPVSVWQGEDDRMVPFAHGDYLARQLPAGVAHLLAGEGHLSLVSGRFGEMLAEARAAL